MDVTPLTKIDFYLSKEKLWRRGKGVRVCPSTIACFCRHGLCAKTSCSVFHRDNCRACTSSKRGKRDSFRKLKFRGTFTTFIFVVSVVSWLPIHGEIPRVVRGRSTRVFSPAEGTREKLYHNSKSCFLNSTHKHQITSHFRETRPL